MNRKPFWFFGLVMAVLSLTAGSLWEPALACTTPPAPTQPPPPVRIRHKTRTTVQLRIGNYTTFGVGAGQFCACGLQTAGLGTIVSVNRARIVRAGTNTPVPGFSFAPNATTTASFASLQLGASLDPSNWQGFFSPVGTPIPADIPTDIVLDVTVNDGSTFDDVAADLATIGTAPAIADGNLDTTDPNHVGLVAPGDMSQLNFAYVANNISGNFTFYWTDSTNGPLSAGPGSPFAAQGRPDAVTFISGLDESAFDWVVVPNSPSSTVSVFRADRDTGALTPIGPPVPSGGTNCTDSSYFTGDSFFDVFVQISHETSNNIVNHRFNRSTGALTQMQSVPTGPSPQKVITFTQAGQRYVVSANCGGPNCNGFGSVSVFGANPMTGLLTEVPGSPFLAGGIGSVFVGVNLSGTVGFVANSRSNDISFFVVDRTGAWVRQGTFPAGGMGTSSVAVDPTDQFVIATNLLSGSGTISRLNPDNTLTLTSTFPTGMGPFSVQFGPTGSPFFYVPNVLSGNVSGLAFDNTTGTATPLLGSPYPAGTGPIKIKIVDPLAPN